MLNLVQHILLQLAQAKISFCHFKSNNKLQDALAGEGDLDLLFLEKDQPQVEALFQQNGFLHFIPQSTIRGDFGQHYFGRDPDTGCFVHLHVYFKLVTGGTLVKNYHLSCAEELIQRSHSLQGIAVPVASDELCLLVVRKMLESASWLESFFLWREFEHMKAELVWLKGSLAEGQAVSPIHLSCMRGIPQQLFDDAIVALMEKKSWLKRHQIGKIFHYFLRTNLVQSTFLATVKRCVVLLEKVFRKISKQSGLVLLRKGLLVAVVGPDASGKSTVTAELKKNFGQHFLTCAIHAGKPPASRITFFPRMFRRLIGAFYHNERATEVHRKMPALIKKTSLIYALRCCVIAYDRMILLRWASRHVSKGCLVVSDRYPGIGLNNPDGPEIRSQGRGGWIFDRLACFEEWCYQRIPQPDLVLMLSVPLGVAKKRNESRGGRDQETEEYLEKIYGEKRIKMDGNLQVTLIETQEELQETVRMASKAVWDVLIQKYS